MKVSNVKMRHNKQITTTMTKMMMKKILKSP
jgi:hypothetical protein